MPFDLIGLLDSLRLRWRHDSLEVFQDNEERFVLDDADGLTLDHRRRIVRRGGRVLADFAEVECIRIRTCDEARNAVHWKLYLGRIRKRDLVIGRTEDQLQGSRVAARMATLLDKPVVVRK
ncbi:MAG: hypothetical protein ACKVP2_08200 [Burkholderiales bacterium]